MTTHNQSTQTFNQLLEALGNLAEANTLTEEELKNFWDNLNTPSDLESLKNEVKLLKYLIDDAQVVSFQEVIDKYKNTKDENQDSCLHYLLQSTELFEANAFEANAMYEEDLKYLLGKIDDRLELYQLCKNPELRSEILERFLINTENKKSFDALLKDNEFCEAQNISDTFDLIEYYMLETDASHEASIVNRMNKLVFSFEEDQTKDLLEILRYSVDMCGREWRGLSTSCNHLFQLVESCLETDFNYESLRAYLLRGSRGLGGPGGAGCCKTLYL